MPKQPAARNAFETNRPRRASSDMIFLLLSRRHRLRSFDIPSYGKFVRRLEWLLIVLVLMGVGYGVAERAGWFDSLWLVWQTVTTVGYGDIPPKTALGRSAVMVCGVVGIILLSYVVSAGIDYRDERATRRKTGLEPNSKEGSYILICCRSQDQLETMITELRAVDAGASVCVVDDLLTELPAKIAAMPDVHFVHGPILTRQTYERAAIDTCKQVIIFPHDPEKVASDAVTRSVVATTELHAPARVPILYFLVHPGNTELFAGARAKVIPTNFALFAAVQECQEPGSADIFTTLMSNVDGANPRTFTPVKLVGWTWGDLQRSAPDASQRIGSPVNLLALISGGKPEPCPAMETRVAPDDRLSLIVHANFSYPDFEAALTAQRSQ